MDRPDGIPQWAWDEAMASPLLEAYLDSEMSVDELLARAILKAREEAYEEAAKIAYDMPHYAMGFGDDALDGQGRMKPGSPYDRGRYDASNEILDAIRQHSQKGER